MGKISWLTTINEKRPKQQLAFVVLSLQDQAAIHTLTGPSNCGSANGRGRVLAGQGWNSMSGPPDLHVRQVLRSAHQESRALLGQREGIVKRIDSVIRTIGGLIDIFGDEIVDNCGRQRFERMRFVRKRRVPIGDLRQLLSEY